MEKTFAIAGPVDVSRHYFLPHRLDPQVLDTFLRRMYYFVLHAPRQSGKTTAIQEYVRYLNGHSDFCAIYISLEVAHKKDNPEQTFTLILQQFEQELEKLDPPPQDVIGLLQKILNEPSSGELIFSRFLSQWAKLSKKPLVIFFDEVDGLEGKSLISFLKQLRSGYSSKPKHFPQSIGLIGVRDLRDYNITAEFVLLKDFTKEDIKCLYSQHTQETGQKFSDEALELVCIANPIYQEIIPRALSYTAQAMVSNHLRLVDVS